MTEGLPRRAMRTTLVWMAVLAVLFVAAWIWNGSTKYSSPTAQLVSLWLGLALIALSAIDLDRYLLPDWLTLPLIVSGVIWAGVLQGAILMSTLGAVIGYGAIAGLGWAWQKWRGEWGIGLGDAKLLAALGAWLGVLNLPFLLLVASGIGLVIAGSVRIATRGTNSKFVLPFGPFLCVSGWLIWCAPKISV